MKPAPFDYQAPATLREAIDLLASDPEAILIAGGQSLMPVLALRLAAPSMLVDLRRVPGLGSIAVGYSGVRLGPGCAGVTSRTISACGPHTRCCGRPLRTSRIIRSVTAAPSAAALPMPTQLPNCRASR